MGKPVNPDINPFGDPPTPANPNINPSGPTTGTEASGIERGKPGTDQEHLNPKEARPRKRVKRNVPPRPPSKGRSS